MIQANIIDQASGIQTQPTIDRSEATSPPSTSTAIIVGKFKRGIIGRPFVVTNTTYKAILGYDPMNPSYLAVEDAFNLGVNKLSVLRTGKPASAIGGIAPPSTDTLLINRSVTIRNKDGFYNNNYAYFSLDINGVMYNADKSQSLTNFDNYGTIDNLISVSVDSGGVLYVSAVAEKIELLVKLSPSAEQKVYSDAFYTDLYDEPDSPQGIVLPNGDFWFKLYYDPLLS